MAETQTLANPVLSSDRQEARFAGYALDIDRSFTGRVWRMRSFDEEVAQGLELCGFAVPLAQMLAARGVMPDSAAQFLDPRLKTLLPDSFVLAHMETAVARFTEAVKRREVVAILADYDVDGACSAGVILQYARQLGLTPLLHVPDRLTEGYGPSPAAISDLRARGAALLITLDCGAAAHSAFTVAAASGLDVIVLDHHAVERDPPVLAHVNPNGPDDHSGLRHVCAAGLTFLFVAAVHRVLRSEGWFLQAGIPEPDLLKQLDVVALATFADVVRLTGVNRAFVRQGLRRMPALERPGFAALARIAEIAPPFSAYHLGFVFGPRINAGGRVGRCDLGARLLASDNMEECEALAAELNRHNRERQSIEAGMLEAANEQAAAQRDNTFVLVGGDGWHPGVVGIIAGRLKDRHAKPALVAGFLDSTPDAVGRGSARSVANIDLGSIIRAAHAEGILDSGGGHAMAAGFSVRRARFEEFADFLSSRMKKNGDVVVAERVVCADSILSPAAANLALLAAIECAGPFGAGNPEPMFLMPDMLVVYAGVVGGNHLRVRAVARDGQGIGGAGFRAPRSELCLPSLKRPRRR